MKLEIIASRMNALGNETRLNIYLVLVRSGIDGLAVGDIQKKLDIPASTLTHHLKRMTLAGLIRQDKCGTTLKCHADYEAMSQTFDYFSNQCCIDGRCPTIDTQPNPPQNKDKS